MADRSIQLAPASTLSPGSLASLVNQVYADYYVRVWMDREQFSNMVVEEDIALEDSLIALEGGMPIGMALLSIRDREGWISGVGTLRAWRRRGIARRILQQLQQTARDRGLQSLRLEVFEQNTPARKLYEDLGFAWERDLWVLLLPPAAVSTTSSGAYSLRAIAPDAALESYSAYHDVRSPWQRDLPSLRHRISALSGLGCYVDGLVGYLLYQVRSGNCAILDLAVDPSHPDRLRAAKALLREVHARHRLVEGYIINVPDDDPLLAAFTDIGYDRWQQQYELVWRPS